MHPRFEKIKSEHDDISVQLSDTSVVMQHQLLKTLNKRFSALQPPMILIKELVELEQAQTEAKQTIEDPASEQEFKEMAKGELFNIEGRMKELENELAEMLVETDPNDEKDVIVEIRGGAGGDEAALFAGSLFRMYTKYAENKGWKTNLVSSNVLGIGGYKEVIFEVKGDNVYGDLKFESGVHRVQRVPETEKSGRIHTSTATVAVLPEAEETDIKIDPSDLRIDTYAAGGKGGQKVNTTNSAVRITHLPSGIVAQCQDERSQGQNKERSMQILRARLLSFEEERKQKEQADARRGQVGTGDRSEKIRTYNFPQDRITDHRIKLTVHNMNLVLEGGLDVMIEKLKEAQKLAQEEASDKESD
jgi:peptide chain release factor 1